MWGCIGAGIYLWEVPVVPSLYVRVYRWTSSQNHQERRSLTVCEGVSGFFLFWRFRTRFPHCMWGCIGRLKSMRFPRMVPSLYVRVYRNRNDKNNSEISSLTVCEGVSSSEMSLGETSEFPHCMWGCIWRQQLRPDRAAVSSLYVRVYRPLCLHIAMLFGSIIVCESVSILLTLWRN